MVSISLEQLCELRPEGQLVKVGVPVQFWCCGVWLVVLFKNDETIYNCNVNAMKKKTVFSTTLHISFKRCWMKSADPIYQHPASHSCSRQSASASWLGSDSTCQLSSLFLWLWHSCWQWAQWTSCWKLSYLSTANKGCCSVVANEHHLSLPSFPVRHPSVQMGSTDDLCVSCHKRGLFVRAGDQREPQMCKSYPSW